MEKGSVLIKFIMTNVVLNAIENTYVYTYYEATGRRTCSRYGNANGDFDGLVDLADRHSLFSDLCRALRVTVSV